jgi:hypothetical protein
MLCSGGNTLFVGSFPTNVLTMAGGQLHAYLAFYGPKHLPLLMLCIDHKQAFDHNAAGELVSRYSCPEVLNIASGSKGRD